MEVYAMSEFYQQMERFQQELQKGYLQDAYKGLFSYIANIRSIFKRKYPQFSIGSSIYPGYMDMTYFSIFTPKLKERKLKIAVVFTYETFSFEVWLSGVNRAVQEINWKLIEEKQWQEYPVASDPLKEDHIIKSVLVDRAQFDKIDMMTNSIEIGTVQFVNDVERFYSTI